MVNWAFVFWLAVTGAGFLLVVLIIKNWTSKATPRSTPATQAVPTSTPAKRSWGWGVVVAISLLGLAGLGIWALWYAPTSTPPTARREGWMCRPKIKSFPFPLILDPISYNKELSLGVEESKEASPPEIIVREGGRAVFSFFVGESLPSNKSVIVRATLIPEVTSPQTHLGDPRFSIGDSSNQKILLRSGGPQEIVLGCPAREVKRGENYFSYNSEGMKFKISGFIRVGLSP